MTTTLAKPSNVEHRWLLVDAQGQVLGRLASRVTLLLRGKHKPTFTPSVDTGDFVVVINAKHIKLTGKKLTQKITTTYSGYPSGLRMYTAQDILARHPERVIEHAVTRMLPQGPLGRHLATKLKIYPGPEHPHQAQNPQAITLNC